MEAMKVEWMRDIPRKTFINEEQIYFFSKLQFIEMQTMAETILTMNILIKIIFITNHRFVKILIKHKNKVKN